MTGCDSYIIILIYPAVVFVHSHVSGKMFLILSTVCNEADDDDEAALGAGAAPPPAAPPNASKPPAPPPNPPSSIISGSEMQKRSP